MEQFQRRISYMNGTISKIRFNLDGVKAQNFEYILNVTSEKLQNLRARLSEDDMEDVLDELDDAVEEVEDGLNELNGGGFSIQIKNLNVFEATICTLNTTVERLRRSGWNITDKEEELEDAEKLLNDLRGLLEEGEIASVKEFLDDVQVRFEDFKNELNEEQIVSGQISITQNYTKEVISSIWSRLQERKQKYYELKEKLVSLNEKLQWLSSRGLNVSDIQGYLQMAREKLSEGLTQYDQNTDLYEDLIDEINRLILKAESLIEEIMVKLDVDVTGANRNQYGMNDTVVSSDTNIEEHDDTEDQVEGTNSTVAVNG
jgi:chromosome segregation ATPase